MPFLGTTGGGSVKQYGGQANLGYFIKNSLRFRRNNKSYFNRTPGTAGNRRTWTWSGWVKQTNLTNGAQAYFVASNDFVNGTTSTTIYYNGSSFKIRSYVSSQDFALETNAQFRDPAAWYHLVLSVDTTHATESQRVKMYVNGIQQTSFAEVSYPSQNYDTYVNSAVAHRIGSYPYGSGFDDQYYLDAYMAEVNFVDGQALTPSSFGKTDAATNQWVPKKFAGTYGTNGFYLKFADASAATAAAIGKDSSGNGNNWTPNNISVTAGATYDAMIDSPTLSAAASNYCTLNPLQRYDSSSYAGSYSSANLIVASGGNPTHGFGTMAIPPGSTNGFYFEGVCTSMDTARTYMGIVSPADGPVSAGASYVFTTKGLLGRTGEYFQSYTDGNNDGTYTTYTTNDVIMVAYKNGKIWFGKNGTWMNSGNPAADTGAISTTLSTSKNWFPYFGYNSTWSTNFGQRPFTYTPPTGFKSLNTFNLP